MLCVLQAHLTWNDQFDNLNAWLNVKGTREHALKQALKDWRRYIVGGMKRRQVDLETGPTAKYIPEEVAAPVAVTTNGRRATRTKAVVPTAVAAVDADAEAPLLEAFLHYTNSFAIPPSTR